MKFLSPILYLLFAVFALISCQKTSTESNLINNGLIKKEASGKKYKVSCSGSCTQGECSAINQNSFGGFECSCSSGCAIVVEIYYDSDLDETITGQDASDYLENLLGNLSTFGNELDQFVVDKLSSQQYKITEMEIVVESNIHGIIYDVFTDSGLESSVGFMQRSAGPTIQVDCNGSCNAGTSGGCRERWIMSSPPSVECTCESDNCGMEITEEDPPQN